MKEKLSYNFNDITRTPARALSAKKILVMSFYLITALAIYDIFTYIALAIEGERLSSVFDAYGFFPFYKLFFTGFIARYIFLFGLSFSVLSVMLGFFSVATLEFEAIKGDRFFSPFHALSRSFKRIKQIVLAELAIVCFVLFIVLIFAIFGLVSRLPFIGEWLYAVVFVIPNFLISLFTVFVILILVVSIILLPATAAAEEKGEAFQAILETFSTIIRRPFRWLGYTLYGLAAGKFFSYIYAYFCYRAVQFMVVTSSIGGGTNIKSLTAQAMSLLPYNSDVTQFMLHAFPGIDWGFSLSKYSVIGSAQPASYLLSFMLFFIFVTIVAYFLSVVATAQLRGYLIIRYLKDGIKTEAEK